MTTCGAPSRRRGRLANILCHTGERENASEMLGRVTDAAVQIFGGMGLMSELPVERWWRDARVERIWDGSSQIQRHIIARSLLRPYGA
jgi:acyl-CoA dehydrogenase